MYSVKVSLYGKGNGNVGFFIRLHENGKIKKYLKSYDMNFSITTDRDLLGLVVYYMDVKGLPFDEAYDKVFGELPINSYVFMYNTDLRQEHCEYCGGGGEVDCEECNGRGYINCETCYQRGSIDCEYCDGEGTVGDDDCRYCDGSGEEECTDCDGDGDIQCPECNGDSTYGCGDCDESGLQDTYGDFKAEVMIVFSNELSIDDSQFENVKQFEDYMEKNGIEYGYYRTYTYNKNFSFISDNYNDVASTIENEGFTIESEEDEHKLYVAFRHNTLVDYSDVDKILDNLFY